MSRGRSENRDKAFNLWEKSGRVMPLVDIAKRLGVSASLVRKWKHEDAWEARPRRKRGGQLGNQNAAGNKGGGAPPGNKNGWKHGMYESMWMSQIAAEHKLKLMQMETDPRQILINEIALLEYREFMLMKNMNEIEAGLDRISIERKYQFFEEDDADAGGAETLRFVDGVPQFKPVKVVQKQIVEEKTKEPQKLERILQIHNAITAVQGRKMRCVTMLDQFDRNELTTGELKLKVERMQLEVNKLRSEAW
ncbi:phage terminase small subunit [Paenibacillus sp. P96]|uniref:Phage terminase small subunit n=1 Tax=Paenibacillus zeirhizosphaerae TaxID=2987519 RepID=A0ABT9FL54_9BACL|nr:phage terminase small subunit [Paenibacillus sp. P96]MDP4095461.1 phage terminase small subunit [Paenibacillus sp. P96]